MNQIGVLAPTGSSVWNGEVRFCSYNDYSKLLRNIQIIKIFCISNTYSHQMTDSYYNYM